MTIGRLLLLCPSMVSCTSAAMAAALDVQARGALPLAARSP